jgi:hypothetical protein
LGTGNAKIFNTYYNVTKKGNFEHGKSILNVTRPPADLAKEFKKDSAEIEKILTESQALLLKHRSKRIRPHRDDKIIAGWNGMMISSMAYGGAVLGEPKYVTAAQDAAKFVLGTLREDGRLQRFYRDGKVVGLAFLDDYAYVTTGLLDLYEATFDAVWLSQAKGLAEQMIELFGDENGGGFYLSGKDGERLIVRNKPSYDGAVPSGNSVAALALLRLGQLTMDMKYNRRAEQVIEAYSHQMSRSPGSLTTMLAALNLSLGPAQEIVIAGDAEDADTKQMIKLVRNEFLPNAVVLFHPSGPAAKAIETQVAFIQGQVAIDSKATAYLCQNFVCKKPVNSITEFKASLSAITRDYKTAK